MVGHRSDRARRCRRRLSRLFLPDGMPLTGPVAPRRAPCGAHDAMD
jgi:hypothetical protein